MMNQPTRIQLYRLLGSLRPDWQEAGTHDAVTELAKQPGTPFELVVQAVRQASIAANQAPVCVTWPLPGTPPKDLPSGTPTPTPASLSVWCERHGCNAKIRDNGELSCCWAERIGADEPSGYVRAGVTAAPADFRERVEKAMAGAQAKETAEQ